MNKVLLQELEELRNEVKDAWKTVPRPTPEQAVGFKREAIDVEYADLYDYLDTLRGKPIEEFRFGGNLGYFCPFNFMTDEGVIYYIQSYLALITDPKKFKQEGQWSFFYQAEIPMRILRQLSPEQLEIGYRVFTAQKENSDLYYLIEEEGRDVDRAQQRWKSALKESRP